VPAKVIDVPAPGPVMQEKKQKERDVAALLRCCVAALLRESLRLLAEEKHVIA